MKNRFNLLRSLLVLASVLAMTTTAFALTLEDTMKEMGVHFKALSVFVNDPSKNQESLDHAQSLATLIQTAKQFTPDTIMDLPAAQRPDAQARYEGVLDQLLETDHQLIAALKVGNQAAAIASVKKMNEIKKEGHSEYK